MPNVFISYRRDDSGYAAQIIYRELSRHFGADSVVFDVDSFPLGVDFVKYLNDRVAQSDALLALIGDDWLTAEGPDGKRRLDDPNDYVRIEIQGALERGIPVVPVLVGKATMPQAADLPRELDLLTRCNAAEVRSGRDFDAHLRRLAKELDRMLALAAAALGSTVRTPENRRQPVPEAVVNPTEQAPVWPSLHKRPGKTPSVVAEPSAEPGQVIFNSIAMQLTLIAAGEFRMGSSEGRDDERPPHRVQITRPFWLGVHQVTQRDYQTIIGKNPSQFQDNDRCPVENVSWFDAVAFCNRLSERDHMTPYYRIDRSKIEIRGGTGYRLPTEAEWEYACRADTTTGWCCGDSEAGLEAYAWYRTNSRKRTHPVGEKMPNAWGLRDMHGNVWEWCWDWYDGSFYGQSSEDDPSGPDSGSARVLRGGSWFDVAHEARSAHRLRDRPAYSVIDAGFRVARDLRRS